MVNTDVLEWIQEHEFDLTYAGIEITPEQNGLLRKEMVNFVGVTGYNLGKVTKQLEPVFGLEKSKVIARTEITRAYSEGNLTAYKESGVVEGKEWNTNRDGIVCNICRPLDSKVVPLDGEFEGGYHGPPAHPGCRCWVSAVVMMDDERIIAGNVVTVSRTEETPDSQSNESRPWWKFWGILCATPLKMDKVE